MNLFLWESKAQSGVNSLPSSQWQSQNQNSDCLPTCFLLSLLLSKLPNMKAFQMEEQESKQRSEIKFKQSENDQYESLSTQKRNSKNILK